MLIIRVIYHTRKRIKGDATPEALATVADAIKLVLANQTRYTLVNEISMLEDNA